MSRWFAAVVLLTTAVAWAQPPQGQPQPKYQIQPVQPGQGPMPSRAAGPAQGDEGGLKGEAKLRWILTRLQLSAEQTKQADALIQVFNAELEEAKNNQADFLRRIQDKLAEIKSAEGEGNQERVKQLKQEIQGLTPQATAENNFFNALEQQLTDAQKARLPRLKELVQHPNEASMRPAHVVALVYELKPTTEQIRKLEDVLDEFRKGMVQDRPRDAAGLETRIDDFAKKVRELLTPDQQKTFDQKIATLRTDPPVAVAMPPGSPATPPPPPAPPTPPGKPGGR